MSDDEDVVAVSIHSPEGENPRVRCPARGIFLDEEQFAADIQIRLTDDRQRVIAAVSIHAPARSATLPDVRQTKYLNPFPQRQEPTLAWYLV